MTSDQRRQRRPARAKRGEESNNAGAAELSSPLGLVQPDTEAEFTADGEIPPGAETTPTYDPSAAERRHAARQETAHPADQRRRTGDEARNRRPTYPEGRRDRIAGPAAQRDDSGQPRQAQTRHRLRPRPPGTQRGKAALPERLTSSNHVRRAEVSEYAAA